MPDIALRFNKDMLTLSTPVQNALARQGVDVDADKVVGKAPALLYVQLKPAAIFATAMSGDARDVLLSHGIACACDDLVPYIVNRKGDGQCPMDASVVGISDPLEGERAIRETVRRMAASRG